MVAGKNTAKQSIALIIFGVFACVSSLQALQTEQFDSSVADESQGQSTEDSRRIKRLGDSSVEDWEMDLMLHSADPVKTSNGSALVLPDDDQNRQLQLLLSELAKKPGSTVVLAQLNTLLADVLLEANELIDKGLHENAEQLVSLVLSIDPDLEGLNAARARLQSIGEVNGWLAAGNAALESGRILEPESGSALHYFNLVLSHDPQSPEALAGLEKGQVILIDKALEFAQDLDFETADEWLLKASVIRAEQGLVERGRAEVESTKLERAVELEHKVIDAMDSGDFNHADFYLIDLIALGGQEALVRSLQDRLGEARLYGGFAPGQLISDKLMLSGGTAPEIVVIAAGSFLMGSQGRSRDVNANEKPQHRVTIKKGFGLGVREVTVGEFRLFIQSSGYRSAAERRGSSSVYDESAGRISSRSGVYWEHDYKGDKAGESLPVLHVSANDAQAYVEWLARETGKNYRLPSEAEYEFVARAGGGGIYWWGEDSPSEVVENLTGFRDMSPGKRQWSAYFKKYGDGHWGPAPVGSLNNPQLVHPMGVSDIAGNVSEWTQDCWHQNYVKAPSDGSAWVNPGCKNRVARGGYWASAPEQSRAAYRIASHSETTGPVIGIRIARDL